MTKRRAKIFTVDVFNEGWRREWVIDYITDDGASELALSGVRYGAPARCEAGWQEAMWRARQWIMCGIKTYGDEYKFLKGKEVYRTDDGGLRWY